MRSQIRRGEGCLRTFKKTEAPGIIRRLLLKRSNIEPGKRIVCRKVSVTFSAGLFNVRRAAAAAARAAARGTIAPAGGFAVFLIFYHLTITAITITAITAKTKILPQVIRSPDFKINFLYLTAFAFFLRLTSAYASLFSSYLFFLNSRYRNAASTTSASTVQTENDTTPMIRPTI